jgi:hypothetical protein
MGEERRVRREETSWRSLHRPDSYTGWEHGRLLGSTKKKIITADAWLGSIDVLVHGSYPSWLSMDGVFPGPRLVCLKGLAGGGTELQYSVVHEVVKGKHVFLVQVGVVSVKARCLAQAGAWFRRTG